MIRKFLVCLVVDLEPIKLHNSSLKWGAKGDIRISNGLRITNELHFWSKSSLTHIIRELIHVLKDNFCMSSFTFLLLY